LVSVMNKKMKDVFVNKEFVQYYPLCFNS